MVKDKSKIQCKWCKKHGHWAKHLTKDCCLAKKEKGTKQDEITASMASMGIEDITEVPDL